MNGPRGVRGTVTTGFSHRDRRAHRTVTRALLAVGGAVAGLTIAALTLPIETVALAAVGALLVLGFAYIGWSDRFLAEYIHDLRSVREGSLVRGFARAEVGTSVGLERELVRPTSPSPHTRRRPPASPPREKEDEVGSAGSP